MKPPPLSAQLLLWLVVVSLLPISLLTAAWLKAFEARLTVDTERHLSDVADRKAEQIAQYAGARLRDARLLARSPETHRALATLAALYRQHGPNSELYQDAEGEFRDYFARLTKGDNYHDVLLVNRNGDIVFSVAREIDFATNLATGPYRDSGLADAVQHAFGALGTEISDFRFYPPSAASAAFIAAPVVAGQRLLGAVALQIEPMHIHRVVADDQGLANDGYTRVAQLNAQLGRMIYMAPLRSDPGAAFQRGVDLNDVAYEPLSRAVHGERGSGTTNAGEAALFAAWRYLPALRWGLSVERSQAQALAPLHSLQAWTLLTLALIMVGLMVAALFLRRAIVHPLRELTETTAEVAAGNLDRRAAVTGFDETRRLAGAFNTMTDNLHTAQQTLELRVRQRTTELEAANSQLQREMEERARTAARLRLAAKVFDNTSEAILVTSADFRIVDANDAYREISGYLDSDLLGRLPRFANNPEHDRDTLDAIREGIARRGRWSGELLTRRSSGDAFPIWLRVNAVTGERGELANYVAIFSDISHLKEAEQRLHNLAYRDFLTDLPNRVLFHERLDQQLVAAQRRSTRNGLLFIDLDRFKYVNDSFGHEAGDKLLVEVARRLRGCVRRSDTVARLGGDEFTILLTDLRSADDAAQVAQSVTTSLDQAIDIGAQEVRVGASIGIAIAPDDGDDSDALLRSADTAMFHAKARGRGNYQFFTAAMNQRNQERLQMENLLRRGLDQREFELRYQPVVALDGGRIVGLEVLLRWRHPELGLLSPGRFLAVAEDSGIIVPIGQWVLRQACRQVAAWNRVGLPPLPLSINLSPRQFLDPELPERIREALGEAGVEPRQLQLEITEGMTVGETEAIAATLEQLSAIGLSLTLDHFGSGHSSMALLRRCPVRRVNIDRSFVRDLPDDADAIAIVTAIVRLSSSLGLEVLAEGVEREQQRAFLVELGCTLAQGYLFAQPLTAVEAEAHVLGGKLPQQA